MDIRNTCWKCGKVAEEDFNITRLNEKAKLEYDKWKDFASEDRTCYLPRDYNENQRKYCSECFEDIKRDLQEINKQYEILRKEIMFENALKILEKQNFDMYDYREEIETVYDFMKDKPTKFQSAYEIISCIVLLSNRINMKIQHSILQYNVDFFIEDYRIVLEIDGYQHANRKYYDNERDKKIREELGNDWEIVRISTDYIDMKADLLWEAAKAIKNEKVKIRRQNHGIIPEWYSKRNKARKPKKVVVGDENLL